ncbi:hypothetical protein B0I21_10562 [Sphingobacterium paludis]|uniref:Uncharacterized protein n=1 Tax=Sphingobacterium paludis TaxID=1476465 RepID=A0A4R7CYV3_9SPHI|nr:hypothetical protein B0I21_10562 [Sphingobacterium paludis]
MVSISLHEEKTFTFEPEKALSLLLFNRSEEQENSIIIDAHETRK